VGTPVTKKPQPQSPQLSKAQGQRGPKDQKPQEGARQRNGPRHNRQDLVTPRHRNKTQHGFKRCRGQAWMNEPKIDENRAVLDDLSRNQ